MNFRNLTIAATFLICSISPNWVKAQLTINNTLSAQDLVQTVLLGTGVIAFNIDTTGLAFVQRARFDGTASNIGLMDGVILSSGPVQNAPSGNDCDGATGCEVAPTNLGQGGDPDGDLNILSGTATNDASIIEFDFIPSSDTVEFNFVFASEEYPEFVGGGFNDAFGFFISGPGIAGPFANGAINIALIPGTGTPVAIDNLNNGTDGITGPCVNCAFYIHNGTGTPATFADTVQYDGFTTVMTAIATVIPCDTFHIKLAVADASDFVYDSAVFLEANSFSSGTGIVIADFGHSAPKCVGEGVDFMDNSENGITYTWNFGAGATPATATGFNPTGVVYSTPGLKAVQLIAASCIDQDTIVKIIEIYEEPSSGFTSSASTICMGELVNFSNTGSTGGTWSYSWDFGTNAFPATSFAENPAGVTYTSAGKKYITLTVSSANCDSTYIDSIIVDPTPVANFSSNAPSCTGQLVDFVNTGTSGVGYLWTFGSGSIDPGGQNIVENPSGIGYTTAGGDIKTVTLVANIGTCTDISVQTINVYETPAPSFTTTGALSKCEGDSVSFTYTGSTGTGWTYEWDFGVFASPSSSNAQNPSYVVYSGPGMQSVSLTVANGVCSDTTSTAFAINMTPIADFSSNAPSCTGDSVYFINTGTTGATAYAWNFGSGSTPGTSTLENPLVVEYDTIGGDIKTITLTTILGFCSDNISKTINITETPAPQFSHDATGGTCEGATVLFTYGGTTDPGWVYAWDFGPGADPATSTALDSIEVSYTGAGSKTVTLTVTGTCSETTVSSTILILAAPVADFSSTGPSCTGDSVDFMNTGTVGATYGWTFGTGSTPLTSVLENPSNVTYTSWGIKTVRLITTLGACVDSSVQSLVLTETPAPLFTNDGPKCEGEIMTFTYVGSQGLGWTYAWDFGSGATPTVSTADSVATTMYTGAGNKTVTLTVTNDNCSNTSIDSTILVNEQPIASLASTAPACTGDSVDFTNTGSTGGSWAYTWTFDSGSSSSSSTDENPIDIIYSTEGTKLITLIIGNTTCSDTAITPININLRPTASFNSTAPQCAGMTIDFDNTGSTGSNWTYLWDFGGNATPATSNAEQPTDITFQPGGNQWISFTISDQNCSETFANTINIDTLPDVNAGPDTTICADLTVQIGSGSVPNISYSWFPSDPSLLSNASISDPTATPTAPVSTYVLTITDTNGCMNTDTVIVTMLQSALVDAGPDVEICVGDSVQLGMGLLEGQTYSWTPATGLDDTQLANPLATPLVSTNYTVTVSFENCPPISDDVYALVHPLPDARATDYLLQDTTYITLGNSILLIATGGLQFSWLPETGLSNPGLYNPVATPDSTTDYVAEVIDIYGCVNWDTVRVDVDSVKFFVPTAFTPDGNGFNDVFLIRIEDLETFELIVWDRWGEQVFISRDAKVGWGGLNQSSGEEMPQGAYVYAFKGTKIDGETTSQSGLINLIR